ncbi:MAG: hypothetical protein HYU66_02565 [Armatimonadetes bacterium]|nr:hypothetical protein [Armatimonadota bacterium]
MSRRDRLGAVVAGCAALAFYLLAASYAAAYDDGLKEAGLAAGAGWGVRGYHLLQTPVYKLAVGLFRGLGYGGPPFVPIQTLNTLCGAVAAAQVWLLLGRVGLGPGGRVIGTAVWVCSATPLLHSRTGDTAMAPMPLVLGAWLAVLTSPPPPCQGGGRGRSSLPEEELPADGENLPGPPSGSADDLPTGPPPAPSLARRGCPEPRGERVGTALLAALLTAAAVLLSLNLVVLIPALLAGAALLGRRPLRAAAATVVLGLCLPYLLAAALTGHTSPADLLHWLTWHEDAKGLRAGGGLLTSALRAVIGLGRLPFPSSPGETAVKAVLRGQAVLVTGWDWLGLARNLAAAGALMLLPVVGWLRRRGSAEARLAGWAVSFTALFNLVWLGSDPQYWLAVYPWLLALGAVAVSGWGSRAVRRVAGGALVIGLLASNLPSPTPTPLQPAWGPAWQEARRAAAVLPARSLVLVPGNSPLRLLSELRPDVEVLDLTYTATETLEGEAYLGWLTGRIDAAAARGAPVVIEGLTAPLPPDTLGRWEMVAGTHGVPREVLEARLRSRWRLVLWPSVGSDVLRLLPPLRSGGGSGGGPVGAT